MLRTVERSTVQTRTNDLTDGDRPTKARTPTSTTVRPSEGGLALARRFDDGDGGLWPAIKTLNGLTSDSLSRGQSLQVPGAVALTRGQTLFSLTRAYDTDLATLKALNPELMELAASRAPANKAAHEKLAVGDMIRVPPRGVRLGQRTEVTDDVTIRPATGDTSGAKYPISGADLIAIAPKMNASRAPAYAKLINEAMAEFGIGENGGVEEVAAFLGQMRVECDQFRDFIEDGHPPDIMAAIGNDRKGDGALFRGRGAIQLTGRYNYTNANRYFRDHDILADPTLVANRDLAFRTAGWYWTERDCDDLSEALDGRNSKTALDAISRRVQGGKRAHAERYTAYQAAYDQLAKTYED